MENGKILLNAFNFKHSIPKIKDLSLDTTLVSDSKVKVINSNTEHCAAVYLAQFCLLSKEHEFLQDLTLYFSQKQCTVIVTMYAVKYSKISKYVVRTIVEILLYRVSHQLVPTFDFNS